jgi:hypothetical protein
MPLKMAERGAWSEQITTHWCSRAMLTSLAMVLPACRRRQPHGEREHLSATTQLNAVGPGRPETAESS